MKRLHCPDKQTGDHKSCFRFVKMAEKHEGVPITFMLTDRRVGQMVKSAKTNQDGMEQKVTGSNP